MKKTIGIIAPLIDSRQFHSDFNLRLRHNNRELTLAALYEFAQKGYQPSAVSRGIDHEEDIPSAGYYLEGLMHQYGYDTVLTNKYDTATLSAIAGKDPVAVLVSTTMILTTESVKDLFASIRKAMPDTVIIAGGIYVWKNYLLYRQNITSAKPAPLPSWLLFHPANSDISADVIVVAPHGRNSLIKILAELDKKGKRNFEDIPNLAIPSPKGYIFTKTEDENTDYDTDYTRWDLISNISVKIPFRTSIGCHFRCRFCDFYQLFPHTFVRSVKSLKEELALIKARLGSSPGILHVSDDNVFVNKKRLTEVCTSIAESGMRKWISFMRAGEYSEDELDLIQRSGLMMGMIGVESGDQSQLDRMNKRQKVEKVKRGIEQLDARGINTVMTFVVGFPGENAGTLQNTADFMNSLSLPTLSCSYDLFPLLVQPLSGLAEESNRTKWNLEGSMENWSHVTMNSEDAFRGCYYLFREVTNIPYHYSEESSFFNRAKFNLSRRKLLFQLRQQLTVNVIGNGPWEQTEKILSGIAQEMGLPVDKIDANIREQIFNNSSENFRL
ncbi:MAG: B12-binding domain-containing radical SAM protein [Syntrophothermus sp.]